MRTRNGAVLHVPCYPNYITPIDLEVKIPSSPTTAIMSSPAQSTWCSDFDANSQERWAPPVLAPTTHILAPPAIASGAPPVSHPAIGRYVKQMISAPDGLSSNIIHHSNIDYLSGVEKLILRFTQRSSDPSAHQAVSGEVDASMFDKIGHAVNSTKGLPNWIKWEKKREKKNLAPCLTNLRHLQCADLISIRRRAALAFII